MHYFKDDTKVYNALEQMRELRLKNAIISNEFGVTLGIVTLNDIIDAVLGDMPEANEEDDIVRRADGTFLVNGSAPSTTSSYSLKSTTGRRPATR